MANEIIIKITPFKKILERDKTFDPIPLLFLFHSMLDGYDEEAPELGPNFQKGKWLGLSNNEVDMLIDPGMTLSRTDVLPMRYYFRFFWKERVMIFRSLIKSISLLLRKT